MTAQNCEDLFIPDEMFGCEGDVINIDATCDDANGYVWYKDGELLINETFDFLSVTESGDYAVEIGYTDGIITFNTTVVFAEVPFIAFNPITDGQVFCQGESIEITATTGFLQDCDTSFNETAIIPDGNGETYSFYIDVICFEDDAVIVNPTDLQAICLNMEHSYLGDLEIELIAPNGSTVTLHSNPASGGLFLGEPIDVDADLSPGVGYEYCFTPDGDVLLVNGETTPVEGGQSIIAGFYLPQEDFSQLLGTPLNGTWEIAITDNIASDNGYLFGVDLQFDPELFVETGNTAPNVIISQGWEPDPTIIATNGDTITVQPNTAGEFCYEYMVEDDFGCTYTETICINIEETVACVPDPLIYCDSENDGFGEFNLIEREAQVRCGNPQGNLLVTFYETLSEAENDTNRIQDVPYLNIIPYNQTVIARLTDIATGCFDIVQLELIVLDSPTANTSPDLILEDTNADGVEVFDLTINETIITDGNPDTIVLYFETLADSQSGTNPISNATSYLSGTRTIYVSVENAQTGCINFTSFNIIVELIGPADNDNDGIPDSDEDVNGNGNLEDDDTDDDGIPNYLDNDDDGDSVPTAIEIEGIGAGFGPQEFIDTDNDMIENYLDNDDDGDGALTIEEDYNNNGSPLDDDTDDSGVPDFLESGVNLGVPNFNFGNVTLLPNPAVDDVLVTWSPSSSVKVIHVYSIRGELLQQNNDVQNVSEVRISLRTMVSGVYFVQLVSAEGMIATQKLIIK
jgi:subtilisin-like proprotein convertase family protein